MIDLARSPPPCWRSMMEWSPLLVRGGAARDRIAVLRNPVVPWRTTRVEAERNGDVLFVGRLERDKGPTWSPQPPARPGLPLTIVGDGRFGGTRADSSRSADPGWRSPDEIAPDRRHCPLRSGSDPLARDVRARDPRGDGKRPAGDRLAARAHRPRGRGPGLCAGLRPVRTRAALAAAMAGLARDDVAVRRNERGRVRPLRHPPRPTTGRLVRSPTSTSMRRFSHAPGEAPGPRSHAVLRPTGRPGGRPA